MASHQVIEEPEGRPVGPSAASNSSLVEAQNEDSGRITSTPPAPRRITSALRNTSGNNISSRSIGTSGNISNNTNSSSGRRVSSVSFQLPAGIGGGDHESDFEDDSQLIDVDGSNRSNIVVNNGSSRLPTVTASFSDDGTGSLSSSSAILHRRRQLNGQADTTDSNGHGHSTGTGTTTTSQRQQNRPRRRRITRSGSQVFLPRLITRDLAFQQSKNRVHVQNKFYTKKVGRLVYLDWFHVLLRVPGYIAMTGLLSVWAVMLLVFAGIYKSLDNRYWNEDCGLGDIGVPIPFATAFAFSLETATTVGYGLPGSASAFFDAGCQGVQVAIFFQMLWSMMYHAFLFAFFYSQLSKSETRSIQVVFSDKLIFREEDDKVYAEVRCYDLDSACPLVEAHARMYLLDSKLRMIPLRLSSPDDELGGMMYPSIPQTISHQVDSHSALAPRSQPLVEHHHGLVLRSVDSATASREELICPVCGEGYGTYERLIQHLKFQKIVETKDDYPMEGTHRGYPMPTDDEIRLISLEEVKNHVERTLSEIVVVVEAIDPQLSGTFQSVQSYKYENIEFGADFKRCLFVRNNKFTVDMKLFHGIDLDDAYHHCHKDIHYADDKDEDDNDDCGSYRPPGRHPALYGNDGGLDSKDDDNDDGSSSRVIHSPVSDQSSANGSSHDQIPNTAASN